jgi:plastocyanin
MLAALLLGTGCASSHAARPLALATTSPTTRAPQTTVPARPVTVHVDAKGFRFTQQNIHITVGTKVVWTFGDSPFPHNVTFDDGTASPPIVNGTWSRRFTKPGTYNYRCTIHPFMRASVIVAPPGKSAAS